MVGFYNELFKHWNVRFRQPSSQSVVDAECIKLEDESGDESDLSKVLGVKGTDNEEEEVPHPDDDKEEEKVPYPDNDPYLFLERARLHEMTCSNMEALQQAMDAESADPEDDDTPPQPDGAKGENCEIPQLTGDECEKPDSLVLPPAAETRGAKPEGKGLMTAADLDERIQQLKYLGCMVLANLSYCHFHFFGSRVRVLWQIFSPSLLCADGCHLQAADCSACSSVQACDRLARDHSFRALATRQSSCT